MKWIFLSPHLDDVIYSCGGFIWDLTEMGQDVDIWTICAGDPPEGKLSRFAASLQHDWGLSGNAVQVRRLEDQAACQIVGARASHFPFQDCIYRRSAEGEFYYDSEEDIFGGLDSREGEIITSLSTRLKADFPEKTKLIAPLGIGNHVDHELTRKAASRLNTPLYFYADYPYARESQGVEILTILDESPDWIAEIYPISDTGMNKWCQAARAYASQLSIFWDDEQALADEIFSFSAALGGMKLWIAADTD